MCLHIGPLIPAGQPGVTVLLSVLDLWFWGADNGYKRPSIQNGEEVNLVLLRSVRFTALRIKVMNLSRGSGKQQERQILPHHWPCLWWPELRVTKVCPLFCHTQSLGICTNTENSEPLLPYWKMRWMHIQPGCEANLQLPSQCSFSLSNIKLSFKHGVKKKRNQPKQKCFLISCWQSGLTGVLFTLETGFVDIRRLLRDYVMCWAFTFRKKFREIKQWKGKELKTIVNTPLPNNITITGLPKTPVTT